MQNAFQSRRSIRKYSADGIPQALIEAVVRAGSQAPSSKNRQPWRFVVVTGRSKDEMAGAFERGLARESVAPLLPQSAVHLPGAH